MKSEVDRSRTLTAWGFLSPALILLGLSVLIPAAMALVMSFTQTGLDVSEPLRFIGFANLRRLAGDPMFYKVLGTTLLYLFGVVPPIVLGALSLAVLVNRAIPSIHIIRAAFYTPVLVSIVVAAIAFRWLYAENGLINGWLGALIAPKSIESLRCPSWLQPVQGCERLVSIASPAGNNNAGAGAFSQPWGEAAPTTPCSSPNAAPKPKPNAPGTSCSRASS